MVIHLHVTDEDVEQVLGAIAGPLSRGSEG